MDFHFVLQLTDYSMIRGKTWRHLPWCGLGRRTPTSGSTSRTSSRGPWWSQGWFWGSAWRATLNSPLFPSLLEWRLSYFAGLDCLRLPTLLKRHSCCPSCPYQISFDCWTPFRGPQFWDSWLFRWRCGRIRGLDSRSISQVSSFHPLELRRQFGSTIETNEILFVLTWK